MNAKKLKSGLNYLELSPLLNCIVFALSLWLISAKLSWIFVLVFGVVSWSIYKKFFLKYTHILSIFTVFLAVSFLLSKNLNTPDYIKNIIFIVLSSILYLLINSVTVLFGKYKSSFTLSYYSIIYIATAYASYEMLFNGAKIILIMFFVYYFTLKSFARFMLNENNRRISAWSAVVSLLSVQLLWGVSFLPIGFINIATIVVIFYIFASSALLNFFLGLLTKRAEITYFVLFLVFSFASVLFSVGFK